MTNGSICSEDANEGYIMHSESGNIEVMTYDDLKEIIEELFESLLSRYQDGLEL